MRPDENIFGAFHILLCCFAFGHDKATAVLKKGWGI
jgi:hypothetical protein